MKLPKNPELVHWLDSARPSPDWQFLSELPPLTVIRCISVGWVVDEDDAVLMLAPNVGDVDSESPQACGFLKVPKRSIVLRVPMVEANARPS